VRAAGGWSAPREIRVSYSQPAGPERIVDYLASISWIAAMPDEERTSMVERIRTIVEAGETPAELSQQVVVGLVTPA
jgi:hypothetical protein